MTDQDCVVMPVEVLVTQSEDTMIAQTLSRRSALTRLTVTAAGLLVAGAAPRTSLAAPFFQTPSTLNLGMVPGEDAEVRIQRYAPIVDYLKSYLGMDVKAYVGTDYTATVEAMRAKRVDAAYFGPFSYVLAAQVADARVFVVPGSSDGITSTYNSLIVTHTASGITDLAGLKGRNFAFVDPASTSGHLIPRAMLMKAGIEPDRDLKTIFAGGHDASLLAINGKRVDAGAVSSTQHQRMIEAGVVDEGNLLTLITSDPIPSSPFAARGSLDAALAENLKQAFLDAHTSMTVEIRKELLGGETNRYVAADDTLYDPIRDTARILNLDLTQIHG
jgi:phosphonate transport system substrate-binding protein